MIYKPHGYQEYATAFIEGNPVSCLLLDMGLGKTAITLTARADLLFVSFDAHRILVVAPLRVARDTWPEELDKWEHLSDLRFSVAVGTEAERKAALHPVAMGRGGGRRTVQFQEPPVKAVSVADEGAAEGQARHRADGNAIKQRADGLMG
jgi:hypothetical protein